MNSKRSYLDTLNTGRQRRPLASLEELNRSLGGRAEEDAYAAGRAEEITRRMERLSNEAASRAAAPREERRWHGSAFERVPEPPFHSLARDIERNRAQEDGVATVGRIAAELKSLREDLRQQMNSGLRREFDLLRQEIERAYRASPAGAAPELGAEIERLFTAVSDLAEKSDAHGLGALRREIEEVKSAVGTLAREETVRSVDRRWDSFDRRFDAFEDRVTKAPGNQAAIAALTARLEQISAAVSDLPESLSLRSLEEKLRTLAGAVEHFVKQQDGRDSSTFEAIEERLDEISRAIAASASVQPTFDPEPFERIEARITSLARQLEEVIEDRPTGEVMQRLHALSERVDAIAERADLPGQAVERLARQIGVISDKLDRGGLPDAERVFEGIEQRFAVLSEALGRRQDDAREQSLSLLRDLDQRLERYNRDAQSAEANLVGALEARFAELSARLFDESGSSGHRQALLGLEARLDDISRRIEATSARTAGIDPELIRSLESQVAGLSLHLSRPGTPLPEFEDIGPRLDTIERTLSESRETLIAAARQAAADAIRSLPAAGSDAALSGLADDLQALEKLARKSDERNTRTFEAIHDTLLKIVERLGALEAGGEPRGPAAPARYGPAEAKLALDAPPIDPGDAEPLSEAPLEAATQHAVADPKRSPAEAAAAAAFAALSSEARDTRSGGGKGRKSVFSGLTRALKSRKETVRAEAGHAEPAIAAPEPAPAELDEPLDPKLANKPLEPGSGAPDLNAIMRRVRDERGRSGPPAAPADAAKSDFIAAARRAAQAAAAEAEILKKTDNKRPAGRFSLKGLLRSNSRAVLMTAAVALIALAGLQLGKAFLRDEAPAGTASSSSASAKKLAAKADAARPESRPAAEAKPAAGESLATAAEARPAQKPQAEATGAAAQGREPAPAAAPAEPSAPAPDEKSAAAPAAAAQQASAASVPAAVSDPDKDDTAATETALPTVMKTGPADVGPAALREAADAGDPKAMFEVGSLYAEGRGVTQDMAKAAAWYEKAAARGLAPAEYRIGNFYEKGTGVARDIKKAKAWYLKAAEQGNASAMHNLAVLYAMGADGPADNDAAARWFTAAAELGVKDSQFNLGILSAKGVGVPQNLEESYKWFALVARTGDRDAAAKRDEVAHALRPEQLQRARAATELWKAKPVDEAANVVDIPDAWKDGDTKTAGIDMKKAVKNIQLILNKNGYQAGMPDGVMGEKTKAAIAAFQKDNGMEATGEVNEKLVQALLEKK